MLIDSEKLKHAILSIMPERSEVLLIVDNQPEAVVRCKDCKRATDYTDEMTDSPYHCRKYGGFHGGNWFCAGGERKDGDT